MNAYRVALANIRYPANRDASVKLAVQAVADAGEAGAGIVCLPEGYVPGYRGLGHAPAPPVPGRQLFQSGALKFGIAICHEGWRYPETVRWPAARGAHVVFHPHLHEAEPGSFRPRTFADPANSFHEKAVLCRAAENTCYFSSVNYASEGSPTTSVIANPDGTVLAYQPYGKQGLLVAEIDLDLATGFLAGRYRKTPEA